MNGVDNKASIPFLAHLEELRVRLFVSLIAVGGGMVIAYFYADDLLRFILLPIHSKINSVYFFAPAEAFTVKIKIAFFASLLAMSPIVISQVWQFVSPALYQKEKKFVVPLILVSSALFLFGAWFCYYEVLPFALQFLVGMGNDVLVPMISVTQYIHFVIFMALGFGVAFNLPVLIVLLVMLKLLRASSLNKYQRHAILLIFIAAAILTPSPDIASQILLAVPLVALFEIHLIREP
jgi:sec-independent protein translocase protein TatC